MNRQALAMSVKQPGREVDTTEWITIAEYTRRHNLKRTNVVTNWIDRGRIPAEDVRTYSEFNSLRMIKPVLMQ
ncbi:hypothetical protein [Larkinella rosea]|uniref:DNA-binding protein n=1 Tax=Larkinella rosea TaxID=2025312 RepID=A0A3P1BZ84_9BACT|nr:hypothetical protein [Larkinella rosea]RRB06278.1 hypothetical protein EHT25_00280 [Larkinella rosea]